MVGMDGCVNSPILSEVGAENQSLSCNYNKSQQVDGMEAMLSKLWIYNAMGLGFSLVERPDCKKEADVPRRKDEREEKRASWWVLFPTPLFGICLCLFYLVKVLCSEEFSIFHKLVSLESLLDCNQNVQYRDRRSVCVPWSAWSNWCQGRHKFLVMHGPSERRKPMIPKHHEWFS